MEFNEYDIVNRIGEIEPLVHVKHYDKSYYELSPGPTFHDYAEKKGGCPVCRLNVKGDCKL